MHDLHMRRRSQLRVVVSVLAVEAGWVSLLTYLGLRLLG